MAHGRWAACLVCHLTFSNAAQKGLGRSLSSLEKEPGASWSTMVHAFRACLNPRSSEILVGAFSSFLLPSRLRLPSARRLSSHRLTLKRPKHTKIPLPSARRPRGFMPPRETQRNSSRTNRSGSTTELVWNQLALAIPDSWCHQLDSDDPIVRCKRSGKQDTTARKLKRSPRFLSRQSAAGGCVFLNAEG